MLANADKTIKLKTTQWGMMLPDKTYIAAENLNLNRPGRILEDMNQASEEEQFEFLIPKQSIVHIIQTYMRAE